MGVVVVVVLFESTSRTCARAGASRGGIAARKRVTSQTDQLKDRTPYFVEDARGDIGPESACTHWGCRRGDVGGVWRPVSGAPSSGGSSPRSRCGRYQVRCGNIDGIYIPLARLRMLLVTKIAVR